MAQVVIKSHITMSEKIRVELIVQGRVQGVCYRAFAQDIAEFCKIKGYAKNLYSGDVEIAAEGERKDIDAFIKELWKGPPMAVVRNIQISENKYSGGFKDFSIKY